MKTLKDTILEAVKLDSNFNEDDFDHRRAVRDKIMKWLSSDVMPPFDTRYKYKLDDEWYLILSNIGHKVPKPDEKMGNGAICISVGTDKLSFRWENYKGFDGDKDYEETLRKVLFDATHYNNRYDPYVYTWTPDSREWKRDMKSYYYDDKDFGNVKCFDINDIIK